MPDAQQPQRTSQHDTDKIVDHKSFVCERKSFDVQLRENRHGRFVRVIESKGGFRSSVSVPLDGLRDLIDALQGYEEPGGAGVSARAVPAAAPLKSPRLRNTLVLVHGPCERFHDAHVVEHHQMSNKYAGYMGDASVREQAGDRQLKCPQCLQWVWLSLFHTLPGREVVKRISDTKTLVLAVEPARPNPNYRGDRSRNT